MARMYHPASLGELLREFMGERTVLELAEYIGLSTELMFNKVSMAPGCIPAKVGIVFRKG